MATLLLENLPLLLLKPAVVAGAPLALSVQNASSVYVDVPNGDSVEDKFYPTSSTTAVIIHVLDNGGHKMYVSVGAGGPSWSRNEADPNPYSYDTIAVPATGSSTSLTLTITAKTSGGATAGTRNQTIIITRRPVN